MDTGQKVTDITSDHKSLKSSAGKTLDIPSSCPTSSSCSCSRTDSSPGSLEPSSKTNSSSRADSSPGSPKLSSKTTCSSSKSRGKRDPVKKAKIEEMTRQAIELQKELQESQLRTSHLRRLQELENELVKLSDEENKRISRFGSEGSVQLSPQAGCGDMHDTPASNDQNESEFDKVKRFCGQIRAAGQGKRISGGGCGGCGIRAALYDFKETQPTTYIRYGNHVEKLSAPPPRNLFLTNARIEDEGTSAGTNTTNTGPSAQNTNQTAGVPSPSAGNDQTHGAPPPGLVAPPPNASETIRTLMQLVHNLMAEIDKVRRKNARNRQKIIELCLALKQKEAAIRECSELLCHIMHDEDDVQTVMEEVQGAQLEKHIEYLRWILIRLQYEGLAMESEITNLQVENKEKDKALNECKATKARICSQKKARETALLSMTSYGACDMDVQSTLKEEEPGKDSQV